jgi:peptidoglycan/xylan/chitin deacetylase (PgdA/CDA1 family)
MRFLSPFLQHAVYPALGKTSYFRCQASSPLRVVTYHGVLPEGYRTTDAFLDYTLISIAAFRSQLRLLKKHYNVIAPQILQDWLKSDQTLPERAVLLTCDDGLLNNLTVMLPILREEGLPCLFFVSGASLGHDPEMLWYVALYLMLLEVRGNHEPLQWNGVQIPAIPSDHGQKRSCWLQLLKTLSRFSAKQRKEFLAEAAQRWGIDQMWKRQYVDDPLLGQRFQLLSAPQVKELAEAAMTIGAHTVDHPVLSEQSTDLASTEIADCRQPLQQCTGQPVWAFAYPFGNPSSVGSREYQIAKAAGYECAFLNVGGPVLASSPRFALPRIHVTAEMSLPVYEAHISGFHDSLRQGFRYSARKLNSEEDESVSI